MKRKPATDARPWSVVDPTTNNTLLRCWFKETAVEWVKLVGAKNLKVRRWKPETIVQEKTQTDSPL